MITVQGTPQLEAGFDFWLVSLSMKLEPSAGDGQPHFCLDLDIGKPPISM